MSITPDYIYKGSGIELQLKYINNNKDSIDFLLNIDSVRLKDFRGIATLILVEDVDGKLIIPESTNREDYSNSDDIMGYHCDSTYSYDADSLIDLVFAMENNIKHYSEFEENTQHRLDFHFYKYNREGEIEVSIDNTLRLYSVLPD